MSTTSPPTHRHPVAAAVACLDEQLTQALEAPVWSMDTETAGETLVALARLKSRTAALEAAVAVQAKDTGVGTDVGASSTENWWAHQTRMTRPETHRSMRFAKALDSGRHVPVAAALQAGDLRPDQAQVIVRAVEDLPDTIDPATRGQAEGFLLQQATDHDARRLRILSKRLLEVIDPETADRHEADQLAKEERAARAAARLTMVDDGHGKTHGRFTLPTAQAAILRKALHGLAAPKHQNAAHGSNPDQHSGERRPSPERLGQAFGEFLERYPTDRLPHAGGVNATIVVTIPLDTLTGGLAAASLDTGERLSPGHARRLACEAGIIPVVLDGHSMPIDYGRSRRFHTPGQRILLGIRDRGCTTIGCDTPPGMCHAHHDPSWACGGPTDLKHARLLCPHHHTKIHDPAYETRHHPGGKVSFHRRT